ncbi:MAG: elongation factor P [Clostridia bacterium]|nr:MAG: elongation factor P [Clostridia bacterium]
MISSNDLRTGVTIEVDGEIYSVVEFLHVKPGKGAAFVRTKLKSVTTGAVIERTFRAGEKLTQARIDHRQMQYLYRDGDNYVFMDTETYEQVSLPRGQLGDKVKYLKEEMVITAMFYEGRTIGIEIPYFIELKVVETEPGLRGDTASGGSKPARLETGALVQVPLFVEIGDTIRVDTRTDTYIERV